MYHGKLLTIPEAALIKIFHSSTLINNCFKTMHAKIKSYRSDLCLQIRKGVFLRKFPDVKHT